VIPPPSKELTPGNILFSNGHEIVELTRSGEVVQAIAIPPVGTETADVLRDLIVAEDDRIAMYNGTFAPELTILDAATYEFSHFTGDGLSATTNVANGGVAVHGDFVFVTDHISTASPASGIVRFDRSDSSFERFAEGTNYFDITVGFDGLLYANNASGTMPSPGIDVYDPVTMEFRRRITLSDELSTADLRGIDVDADGTLYAAAIDDSLHKIAPDGSLLDSLNPGFDPPGPASDLHDINVAADGTIVAASRGRVILVTNVNFDTLTTFPSPRFDTVLFNSINVAFTDPRPTTIAPPDVVEVPVHIDINPRDQKNKVDLKAKHLKPLTIAVLGEDWFDIDDIAPETAVLSDPALVGAASTTSIAAAGSIDWSYSDVNRDGFLDLLLVFDLGAMRADGSIVAGTKELVLKVDVPSDGAADFVFVGSDVVNPPKPPKPPKK
jgi:hypothetical protein